MIFHGSRACCRLEVLAGSLLAALCLLASARAGEDAPAAAATAATPAASADAFGLAAAAGQIDVLEASLQAHPEYLDQFNGSGETALTSAVRQGQFAAAQWLIDRHADPNLRGLGGASGAGGAGAAGAKAGVGPLECALTSAAAQAHRRELVELLVTHRADANQPCSDGRLPALAAMQAAEFECAGLLFDHGADANAKTGAGRPLLMEAIAAGVATPNELDRRSLLKRLLEQHADPNVPDADGHTPLEQLLRAVEDVPGKYIYEISLLIEFKADPNRPGWQGRSAMSLALELERIELIQLLLEKGGDPHATDADGRTFLHLAAKLGRVEFARRLIDQGAAVDAADLKKRTPLQALLAEWRRRVPKEESKEYSATMALLLEHGANPNWRDAAGLSPFVMALNEYSAGVVLQLVNHGGDPATLDPNFHWPVLFWAIHDGDLALVQAVLDHGADVNAQSGIHDTPLHQALFDSIPRPGMIVPPTQAHTLSLLNLLIDRHADVNLLGAHSHETPLHRAAHGMPTPVVELLMTRGGRALAVDGAGRTALMAATPENFAALYRGSTPIPVWAWPLIWLGTVGLVQRLVRGRRRGAPVADPATTAPAPTAAAKAPAGETGSAVSRRRSKVARSKPASEEERLALQTRRSELRDVIAVRRRFAWLPLASWAVLLAFHGCDPFLRSMRPPDWIWEGGLVLFTGLCVALLYARRAGMIASALIPCLLLAILTAGWTVAMAARLPLSAETWGLQLCLVLHLASIVWLAVEGIRIFLTARALRPLEIPERPKGAPGQSGRSTAVE